MRHSDDELSRKSHKFYSLNYQKAGDKIFICKFLKDVKYELCHIKNSLTRGQIA